MVRSELRARWRASLGLALILGLFGGAVIAAVAAARRTETAYPRFLDVQRAQDVAIGALMTPDSEPLDLGRVERLPQVSQAARLTAFETEEGGQFGAIVPVDARFGRSLVRWKVVSGRLPALDRVDEAVVGFRDAQRGGVVVGSTVRLRFLPAEGLGAERRPLPVTLTLKVVGIVASPLDFTTTSGSPIIPGPAFYERYAGELRRTLEATFIRLERGGRDLAQFLDGVERLSEGKVVVTFLQKDDTRRVQRSFRLQAAALWVLAAFFGLTALLVYGQALARETSLESVEYPTLRALGVTRGQLFGTAMVRSGIVSLVGAAIAVAIAFAASPLAPLGEVRIAEPRPGLRFDVPAIGLGAVGVLGLVVLLAVLPAWRAARLAGALPGAPESSEAARPSRAAEVLAGAGLPPSVVIGARFALETGRGRTAVPVRSTLMGMTLGLAALAVALSFDSSLNHLLGTPRLYGLGWDAVAELSDPAQQGRVAAALRSDGAIEAFAFTRIEGEGVSSIVADIDHLPGVSTLALDDEKGSVLPPIVEGRAPSSPDEIVLASKTLDAAGKHVGDTVAVRVFGAGPRTLRVVGRGLIPPLGDSGRLGEGALIHTSLVTERFAVERAPAVVFRLSPGADERAVLDGLRARFADAITRVYPQQAPNDLVDFGRVRNMPLLLAALVAGLVAAMMAHILSTSIRRRRRDLAILRSLGFVPGQVRRTIAWHAAVLASVALLFGLPVGIVAGHWLWTLFTNQRGIVPEPDAALFANLLSVPAMLVLANLIATRPARAAARVRPASVLRSE